MQGLQVEPPLASDQQIGPHQRLLQTADLGDQLDAGAKARAEEAARGEADAAGRAAAGQVAVVMAECLRAQVGEAGEGGVELVHLLGRCPLLRTEHLRGAARPAQRVVDVAGHLEVDCLQARIEAAQVDVRQLRQRRAARL
ncbi:hypothetical protein D3C75_1020360 [compost metagenome]